MTVPKPEVEKARQILANFSDESIDYAGLGRFTLKEMQNAYELTKKALYNRKYPKGDILLAQMEDIIVHWNQDDSEEFSRLKEARKSISRYIHTENAKVLDILLSDYERVLSQFELAELIDMPKAKHIRLLPKLYADYDSIKEKIDKILDEHKEELRKESIPDRRLEDYVPRRNVPEQLIPIATTSSPQLEKTPPVVPAEIAPRQPKLPEEISPKPIEVKNSKESWLHDIDRELNDIAESLKNFPRSN